MSFDTGTLLGVEATAILAKAQSLLTRQLAPGAIKAAQAEAESAKAQGVVLHVAEAAANWGVRKVIQPAAAARISPTEHAPLLSHLSPQQ